MTIINLKVVNLFKLLEADCTIYIKVWDMGYEVERVENYGVDAIGNSIIKCEDSNENAWYFVDQKVDFQKGACTAKAYNTPECVYDFTVTLNFRVSREMTLEDLA